MQFHYTAVRENGEEYEGTVESPDRFGVYSIIRKEGGTVTSIKKVSPNSIPNLIKKMEEFTGKIKEIDKIILSRNLAAMIKAGLPLSRALSVMSRQGKNEKLKRVIKMIGDDITRGTSFHVALKKFPHVFSPLFVSMVKAGEESGKLAEALSVVGRQMDRAYKLKKKIKGALIYPAIIVIAMVVIGIVMLVYVVPTLTQTFEELGVELPKSTQAIISASNFLTDNTILALGLFSILILLFVAGFRTKRGQRMFDFIILHIPIVSTIVKETNAARTTRTLASLLSSGVEVVTSISITKDVIQNSYYKKVLARAGEDIQKGLPIADAFAANEHLYPPLVGEMIAVGGETGQLSEMLEEIAVFYESEVEQKTKDLSTVIEPFLMLFIGAVVGFFAISMISPIYSLSSGI